jgi:hypothetical protein
MPVAPLRCRDVPHPATALDVTQHVMRRILAIAMLLTGCTTLGPMPATTGVSAMPAQRPHGEVSTGFMPAYLLSRAASDDDRDGDLTSQLSLLFEPDRLLGIPGLVVATRYFGEDGDFGIEPIVGYRKRIQRFAVSGLVYGTRLGDEAQGASYEATRMGGEVSVAARLEGRYIRLDAQLTGAATYLSAEGQYCVDQNGYAIDCGDNPRMVDAEVSGVYPSATASLALDLGPLSSWFHGARLSGMFSVGYMPALVNGQQQEGTGYISGGVLLSLGFGARD